MLLPLNISKLLRNENATARSREATHTSQISKIDQFTSLRTGADRLPQILSTLSLHLVPVFVLLGPRQIFIPFFLAVLAGALTRNSWRTSPLGTFFLPFLFLLAYTFIALISSVLSPLSTLQVPIACKGIVLVSGFGLSLMAPAPRITFLFWGMIAFLFCSIGFLPWVDSACFLQKIYLFIFQRQEYSALFGLLVVACLFLLTPHLGRTGTAFLIILSILILFQWRIRASILGFIGAFIFYILSWLFFKHRPWLNRDFLMIALLPLGLSPLWITSLFPPDLSSSFFQLLDLSFQHRVYLWEFFLSLASQKFWLGWGAGLGGKILETLQPLVINIHLPLVSYIPDTPTPRIETWINLYNVHPHNFFLQAYVEGGVLGYLCFFFALITFISQSPTSPGPKTVLWYFIVLYIALPISVSFSLLSTWWLCGLFLLPFICRAYTSPKSTL